MKNLMKRSPNYLSLEHASSELLVKLGFDRSPFHKTLIEGFGISLLTTHVTSVNLSTDSLFLSQARTIVLLRMPSSMNVPPKSLSYMFQGPIFTSPYSYQSFNYFSIFA